MKQAMFVKGWSGLYTVTPDWNMILDKSPDVDGLYLAVGGSGHSFKISPAIGLCMAELIVDGAASTVDITPLQGSPLHRRHAPVLYLRRQPCIAFRSRRAIYLLKRITPVGAISVSRPISGTRRGRELEFPPAACRICIANEGNPLVV